MPTTCCVVNCNKRHSASSNVRFYRFPKDPDRRRRWLAFVSRRNRDGSPWMPGQGDRVCSCHFISGEKSNIPSSPDYVPTVYPDSQCVRDSEDASLVRFERAQRRSINRQHQIPEEESPDPVHSAILPDLTGFNHDHRLLLKRSSLCVPETSTITCGTVV